MSEKAKHERDEPDLRFPEFDGAWENYKLANVTTKIQDGTHFSPETKEEGEFLYITSKNIRMGALNLGDVSYLDKRSHDTIYKRCDVRLGDILLTKDGASTGNVCINTLPNPFSLLSSVAFLRVISNYFDNRFLYQIIASSSGQREIKRSIAGQAITRITLTKLRSYVFDFPPLPEQQKIASFLSAMDEKIAQLEEKKNLLEDYKKGCMQQLFSQALRFKDEDGNDFPDWEEKRFNEVFERIHTKNVINNENVLTISAQMGLVNQIDYFNHSVSAKDISGYYLLEKGDFAYNKSYSKGYPMGAIKRLNLYKLGVVSTLYICFRAKHKKTATFYEQYFNGGNLNHEIYKIAQEGARNHGLLNMSVLEFFKDIKIMYPHPDEQQKITNFLSALDDKITHAAEQLKQIKSFKKGLLQKMFV